MEGNYVLNQPEEFTQGIQTFFSHKASHNASLKNPKKKVTPLLIPYGRFSKVIIYYLASNNNIHRRPESAVHHTGDTADDFILGNLKFVPKGESVEVFGMAIPDPLITEAIQQSSYYPKYLKMVDENTKKTPKESASVQPATKRATPKKPTTTTPVKQSKPALPPTKKPSKRKLPQKVRRGKPTFKLVDEDDDAQQESNPQEEGNDPELELAKKLSLEAHQEKGGEEGNDADLERAIKLSLDPALLPQSRAPVGGVTIRDPVSEASPKLHEVVGKGKAIVTEEQVAHSLIDMSKKKRTTDQFILVRRDQTPPDSTTGPSSQPDDDTSEKVIHESSSTSDSERTKSETEAAAPKGDKDQDEVDTSIVIRNERVIDDKPESHSVYMSSMNNLDDTFNFGDQFLHDKPTEDDQEEIKANEESDFHIPDLVSDSNANSSVIVPFTVVSSSKPSLLLRVGKDWNKRCLSEGSTDHSADNLIRDLYSVLPGVSVKNQESEKSPKEIIKPKRNNAGRNKIQNLLIRPSAGSNQGRSTKRRRSDSAASGSAKPPPKNDDQSSKKPRESEASASKQHEKLSPKLDGRLTDHIERECHKLLTNKVDLSNPEGHQILRNIYEPLLRRTTRSGDKERRIALSISKLKATRYLDFGLKELVPSLWVESEREYDISAVYGITHWWFKRKDFYINKHSECPLMR
ncbi:hypothetical protein Tco_1105399 [Tanacetum coccineum]